MTHPLSVYEEQLCNETAEKNKKKGKRSRRKGTVNQAKSKQYILKHPEIYGIDFESLTKDGTLQSSRVHSMINSAYPTPFKDLFTRWDIITMPINSNFIYLIQVKTTTINTAELLELAAWETPVFVKREIHVWKDGQAEPLIYKL